MIPKRLGVDFDNTLFRRIKFPDKSAVTFGNRIVHWYVKWLKKRGWVIILNTCRREGAGLEEAKELCELYNIPIDLYNENEKASIERYGDTRKIACDKSLDDTQIGFIGWLLRRFC